MARCTACLWLCGTVLLESCFHTPDLFPSSTPVGILAFNLSSALQQHLSFTLQKSPKPKLYRKMYLECPGSQGSTWTVTEPCHTPRQESLDHDFMKMATALASKIAEQGISSFRRLLLRQKEDLLYRPDHSYPLSYLSSGAHKWSRLQRQGCSLTPFSFRKEMRLKRGMYIWCVSERHTARVDNVQLRGMCSTRGESASSQDLQKHIAATTSRLSQTAPVLANQSWLLPAYTCPALTEPVTTAALWKCGRVEGRDKHGKAAAD